VGLTRAKNEAILSFCRMRSRFGQSAPSLPSRFLLEIPEPLLDTSGLTFPLRGGGERREPIDLKSLLRKPPPESGSSVPDTKLTLSGATPLQVGDKVRHQEWGQGVVVKVSQDENDDIIAVAFPQVGIKRLAASVAPLRKI